VESDTYVIDPDQIERMITPKTQAMIISNLIDNLADWETVKDVADRYGLKTIEDSADTLGSLYKGRPTGTHSDIVTTSFYASHVITGAGFGGMACFNDQAAYNKAKQLRGWGRGSSLLGESESIENRFNVAVDGIDYDSKFVFDDIGYNFLPTEISAAFALEQLKRLDEYGQRRLENFTALVAFFADFEDWFILPRQQPDTRSYWLAVPLIVRPEAPFSRRDLQVYFESRDIQTRTIFTGNILRQEGFSDIPHKADPAGYPNADRVMEGGLLLGCHQGMTQAHLDRIAAVFTEFAKQY
jgi:CDP-6-deoxy-D-xylo-4-hexulose-3-dehydrase